MSQRSAEGIVHDSAASGRRRGGRRGMGSPSVRACAHVRRASHPASTRRSGSSSVMPAGGIVCVSTTPGETTALAKRRPWRKTSRANDGGANDGRANDDRANDGPGERRAGRTTGRPNDGRANDGPGERRAGRTTGPANEGHGRTTGRANDGPGETTADGRARESDAPRGLRSASGRNHSVAHGVRRILCHWLCQNGRDPVVPNGTERTGRHPCASAREGCSASTTNGFSIAPLGRAPRAEASTTGRPPRAARRCGHGRGSAA
jgi:hypothetical protein